MFELIIAVLLGILLAAVVLAYWCAIAAALWWTFRTVFMMVCIVAIQFFFA
jgi:hypothetical protein